MPIADTSAQDTRLDTNRPAFAMWRRFWGIGLFGLLLLAVVGWLMSRWLGAVHSVDVARLQIAEVKQGDLVRDISADGRVIAANSPTLYAISAGKVTLKVVAGDAVKQGQALAVVDSPELLSRLRQEDSTMASMEADARRALLDAQLARSNAQKTLDQALIDYTTATRDLQRYQRGYEGGALPQIMLATAQDNMKKAALGLSTAQRNFKLQGESAGLDAKNKQLLAGRQRAVVAEIYRQVDALTIRAPFDGQVGQVQVPQGTNVAANGAVLSVVDLSKFEVEIKVPESFARDLNIGMPAQVMSDGKPWSAEVSAVSPEVVNSEVNARVRFAQDQQPPGLRQNQRLSARILLDTRRHVLMVDRGPFVEQNGGGVAYVVEGDTATRRAVRLGASSLNQVEVLSGLRVGDHVVISGTDLFGNQDHIRLSGR